MVLIDTTIEQIIKGFGLKSIIYRHFGISIVYQTFPPSIPNVSSQYTKLK